MAYAAAVQLPAIHACTYRAGAARGDRVSFRQQALLGLLGSQLPLTEAEGSVTLYFFNLKIVELCRTHLFIFHLQKIRFRKKKHTNKNWLKII